MGFYALNSLLNALVIFTGATKRNKFLFSFFLVKIMLMFLYCSLFTKKKL